VQLRDEHRPLACLVSAPHISDAGKRNSLHLAA
jgi:hypothetical protein